MKTFESLSESTIQLALNGTVMKEFGIEKPWLQITGAVLSMLSISRSSAARYAFVQHNVDPGFTMKLGKAMGILLLPTLSTFTAFTILITAWSAKEVESIVQALILMHFHSVFIIGICEFLELFTKRRMKFDVAFLELYAILIGCSFFVVYISIIIVLFMKIQEGEEPFSNRKIFNSSIPFNICDTGEKNINNNIDMTEWLSTEQVFWFHWMWILPFLFFIMITHPPCHQSCQSVKDFMAPSVSMMDFMRGPKIAVDEHEDSNANNEEENAEDNREAFPMIAIPISSENQSEEEENDPEIYGDVENLA